MHYQTFSNVSGMMHIQYSKNCTTGIYRQVK